MTEVAHQIGRETIEAVSQTFYAQIRQHANLGPIFQIVENWPKHEAHITHFWWVLLGGEAYLDTQYNVARKHIGIGVTPELVQEWLALFEPIVEAHVAPELAAVWLGKARMIGQSITMINSQFQP